MNPLLKRLIPPPEWQLAVILMLGALAGLSLYAFYSSKAYSYLSDAPETCVNCHIMAPQYATWQHSSHREVASCNDCHVPHDNIFRTYYFKAMDGARHATMFTLRLEPQNIFIKEAGIGVVQENCIRCHSQLITDEKLMVQTEVFHHKFEDRLCWECHREVPHGRVKSLSSTPYARVPMLPSPVPAWLKEMLNKE
ncbi:MAG TPA: cytochrome c nitrite reductase small subunit [Bacteroidales bacterium]|jgi:cytochrome c nitrite reductase small subunit|nr:cytochrome c nitrite reductase small subunit [Bacteroidales bacterium]MDD4086272.1 cytochrome c nitrite reductase small subunit [Bacteroidales bacterium]MDY0084790.1 cytochrome c nitrite reductase small subunit [Bacteroidales bacterium]HPE42828.1 cytochrome c nitrite reductase small subunit [Bacteroidales bacterium]